VFRKGHVAFQRPGGYNTLLVDMSWRRPLRLAVKLPDTPASLALANPYPDLEENWGEEDREWGWTLIPGKPIPDLRPPSKSPSESTPPPAPPGAPPTSRRARAVPPPPAWEDQIFIPNEQWYLSSRPPTT
jgi:hypothetical protein